MAKKRKENRPESGHKLKCAPSDNRRGDKKRPQASVRYNNGQGDNFTLYSTFDSVLKKKFFCCIVKCLERRSRGSPEVEGLEKFPELQDVMRKLLPLESQPVGFENQSEKDKVSILEKLAAKQAEKASEIYDRNKANSSKRNQAAGASGGHFFGASTSQNVMPSSVPCDGSLVVPMSVPLVGGTGIQLDNPEARLPHFSDQELIDMLISKLERRASSYPESWLKWQGLKANFTDWLNELQRQERSGVDSSSSLDNAMDDGLPDVASLLEDAPMLTGRKRANEGDVYPPVRSPLSQMLDEFDKEQLQLFASVDGAQQLDHDVLAQEGDDNQTNHLDNMQVEPSIATYHDSADLRVDVRSCPLGSDLEVLRVQQFHGTRAEGVECNASHPQSNDICGEDMVTAMENGNMGGLSVVSTSLEGVPWSTGRNRANLGDDYQQLFATNGLISVKSSLFDQEDFDYRKRKECEQDAENLLDSFNMPNPEGGVAEGFTASTLSQPCSHRTWT